MFLRVPVRSILLAIQFTLWVSTAAPLADDSFEFIANDWTIFPGLKLKRVHLDDFVLVSCATNDPKSKVTLLLGENPNSKFINAKDYFKDRMTQAGTDFKLHIQTLFDGKLFRCHATVENDTNEITMDLGRLLINPARRVVQPNIFPNTNGVLEVDIGSEVNVHCEAEGIPGPTFSYLTWYKQDSKGRYHDIAQFASIKVSRKGVTSYGQNIDVETLTFIRFSKKDEGVYSCLRYVPGSRDDQVTRAFVKITQNRNQQTGPN